jgi:uncharacterized surface protein with fasciclin (FAS1) repeats
MTNGRFLAMAVMASISLAACGKNDVKSDAKMADEKDTAMVVSTPPAATPSTPTTMPAGGENPMVGGMPMYANKSIVENAVTSPDHTTLVAAVKAAGLVETLSGAGPFTVFAPVNAAFDKLPAGTVETLVKPENKEMLTGILTYHVVPGTYDAAKLSEEIKAGNGKAMLKTASGGTLTASMEGPDVIITDAKGAKAKVTIADVRQSNGVIHVVDAVLMPK